MFVKERKSHSWLYLVLIGAAIVLVMGSLGRDDSVNAVLHEGDAVQPAFPDSMIICGEEVPLDIWYVREALDRELLVNTFWHSQTMLHIKRANRYLPAAREIFRAKDVPEDLVYLAVIESGLQVVTSPAGAQGYWQFMQGTAREYGLEVNREVDERNHFVKAAGAAAEYLRDAYARFGSWILAAAAYNRGMEGMAKALKSQGTDSFYHTWLNPETSRYIYRLLAVKLILEEPGKYGFRVRKSDLYPELQVSTVHVDSTIPDLTSFARQNGTTLLVLRKYNPWLISNSLTVKSREYDIAFPENGDLSYPDDWFGEQNSIPVGMDNTNAE